MGDAAVEAVADQLCNDTPSIADAFKSYCSALSMARELKGVSEKKIAAAETEVNIGSLNLAPKGYDAYVAAGHDQEDDGPHFYDFPSLVSCAKVVLKLINAHELPKSSSPACVLAHERCRAKGSKPTKMFGRQYLEASNCWDTIRPQAEAALAEELFPARMIIDFLEGWSKVLSGSDKTLAGLVWATDFKGELSRRLAASKVEPT